MYKCSKCSSIIPAFSKKCPVCRCDINFFCKNMSPPSDKYKNKVKMLPIDYNKNMARMKYINENFVRSDVFEKTASVQNTVGNHPLSIPFILLFACLCILTFIVLLKTMPYFSFGIVIFSELLIILTGIITVKKLNGKHKAKHIDIDTALSIIEEFNQKSIDEGMYSAKAEYYFSNAVIGYSVFDHVELIEEDDDVKREYRLYAHYELDKSLIKEVKYNSEYAGYELWTTVPVYDDTDDGPKDFWFIPDIFDDNDLSLAVGRSLPAKIMNF